MAGEARRGQSETPPNMVGELCCAIWNPWRRLLREADPGIPATVWTWLHTCCSCPCPILSTVAMAEIWLGALKHGTARHGQDDTLLKQTCRPAWLDRALACLAGRRVTPADRGKQGEYDRRVARR